VVEREHVPVGILEERVREVELESDRLGLDDLQRQVPGFELSAP